MIKNKTGKIINITSIVGHTGNVGQANYAASKAGLIGMSKSLALEYGKKNIKVNCISPGFIKSEMTDKISEKFQESLQDKISLNRFGLPEDVANAVVFLSSNLAEYITGETMTYGINGIIAIATYTGGWKEGQRHGYGEETVKNELENSPDKYSGKWNQDTLKKELM